MGDVVVIPLEKKGERWGLREGGRGKREEGKGERLTTSRRTDGAEVPLGRS